MIIDISTKIGTTSNQGGFKGLLDVYSGAAAAYSLRKLSKATTSVVRVRRDSDNAEADFTAQEITDGTLAAFCTGTDGLVTTWYDQSGNANNATQATAASQPQIVSSGSIITDSGYQVIQYDGSDDNLGTSFTATGTMLMGGSDGGAFYEISRAGAYDLLASAANTDHPLKESIRVIWGRTLSAGEQSAIESRVTYSDWDFSDVTSFFQYWRDRSELTGFPVIDTSNRTNFINAWFNCSSLTSFPLLDVSSGTNFLSAWNGCSSLTSFPLLDVSSGTNFQQTWQGCLLTSFPALDVSSGTNFIGTWLNCSALQNFPANMFDSVTATAFTNAFLGTNLTQTSIDNILTSIDTANTSNGTFTQSGGSAPSATGEAAIDNLRARGWTVTVTGGY